MRSGHLLSPWLGIAVLTAALAATAAQAQMQQKTQTIYSDERSMCWSPIDRAQLYSAKPDIGEVRREMPCPPGYIAEILDRGGDNCVSCASGGFRCRGYVRAYCKLKSAGADAGSRTKTLTDTLDRIIEGEERDADRNRSAAASVASRPWDEALQASGFAAFAALARQNCEQDLFTRWDASTGTCKPLSRAQDAQGTFGTKYESGGAGVHVFDYSSPGDGVTLRLTWDFRVVPDRIVVFFGRTEVLDTGLVSGTGARTLPAYFGRDGVRLVVTGGAEGTAWSFSLSR